MIFFHNPCTCLIVKEKTWKRVFNSNSELLQNRTEKQIMPFKITVNWLFTDIWCYLAIGCFDWKTVAFQQKVVQVYYILEIFGLIVNIWKESSQKKEHDLHSSVFYMLRWLSCNLTLTDPLIISFIFIFLSCHEKAHHNKESCKN